MKLFQIENVAQCPPGVRNRGERGFVATTLFIALLVIMLMLATAGGKALVRLHSEVKILERQQIKRLDLSATNSVAIPRLSGGTGVLNER